MKDNRKKFILKIIAMALSLVTLLAMCTVFTSCSNKNESTNTFVKVDSKGKKIKMEAVIDDRDAKKVYLFAISPWQTASDIDSLEPLADGKVKNGTAKVSFKVESDLTELLTKGYLLAKQDGEGYTAVTGTYYITNPRDIHSNAKNDEEDALDNIKGAIGTTSQLLDLGVKSTVVTVDIGDMLSAEGGSGKMPYVWDGYTYYVYRDELEELDRKIKGYTDANIRVFLELVQTKAYTELDEGVREIAFPTASGDLGYALNMSNREGANRIIGFFDLLADRYSCGGEYGEARAFIIGRSVNNYPDYYSGATGVEHTALNYLMALRAAYNVLLSHTPDGRVYAAIDNNWNVANYNAREFLSTLANIANEGGDFFWQVSVEANASDASLSAIWKDDLAGSDPEFISPANIEVLSRVLSSGPYLCNGMQRNLLLNRFSVGGINEEERAASYAYAYYKCIDLEKVDGLIYGRMTDRAEGSLNNGLLTAETANRLSERKKIADIVASIDNEKDGQVDSVGVMIGQSWKTLYDKHKKEVLKRSVVISSDSEEHSSKNKKQITDFSGGNMFGFSVASSDYVELKYSSVWDGPVLYASLSPESASDMAGVITSKLSKKELKNAGYIGITAMVDALGNDSANVTVRLSGYAKNGTEHVFVYNHRVKANSWFESYYDIEDFLKKIKDDEITLSVVVSPSDASGEVSGLWISELDSEEPIKKGIPTWIIVVLICLAVGGGITAFVIWFNKNYMFVKE